jgi:hypothetical protein
MSARRRVAIPIAVDGADVDRPGDPRRTDFTSRMRVSILVDRETWAEFQAGLIRKGIATADGPTDALRAWLARETVTLARAARQAR